MNKGGFTLVETLVTAAIFLVIMIGVTAFERDVFFNNSVAQGSYTSAQGAEEILRDMVSPLRSASEGSDGSYPVLTAATGTLTFFSDLYNNGVKERVTYFISGTNLEEAIAVPTGTPLTYGTATGTIVFLATNVRNISSSTDLFTYYDDTYNGTSSPMTQPVSVSAVRLVKISLVLDVNPYRAPAPVTYTTQVSLRNLKDNL